MIEGPTYPVCETMAPSPQHSGQQLVCFRRRHADPWHYDNRGLGVSFRVNDPLTLNVTALLGILPEDADAKLAESQADWDEGEPPRMTEAFAAFSREPNLPARLALSGGELDVDAMRAQLPAVRQSLLDALRHSATLVRASRGTVVVPEDTYDLVRRLTAAQEVLGQWQQAFADAGREAAALIEEEAMTVAGSEQDGVLTASLFVPDGEGQRIAVRADWKAGESTWDTDTLKAWIAEDTVAELGSRGADDEPLWSADEMVSVARDALDRLTALGRFAPGAKPIEELRRKLAGQQRDADAAVLRQVRSVGPRTYAGAKITREESK